MIEWYWIPVVACCFAIGGAGVMALLTVSGRSELEMDNMRLREKLAELKQVNHELGLFNSRQSGECADGTEMQK